MAGPRTKRGKWALALASVGALLVVGSAFSSWVQPARVSWPSYTDGVPDWISHPSAASFQLSAGLLGAVALMIVAAVSLGVARRLAWGALLALGCGGLALGVLGFRTVAAYRGFGSMIANDMTLHGFHHSLLSYAELAGASLLFVSSLAALQASRSAGR